MARLSNDEVERRRRSIAMLATGAPAGLTREEAMEILEESQRCRSCGRRLLGAMREVRLNSSECSPVNPRWSTFAILAWYEQARNGDSGAPGDEFSPRRTS